MKSLLIHISSVLKSMKTFRRLHGFTVIELLIVITIIGILASLLTPTIQSSLEHAKAAKCLGNLHQVGTAVQSYIADPVNNNKFPHFFDTNEGMLAPLVDLSNYGITTNTLSCPADPHPAAPTYSYFFPPYDDSEQSTSIARVSRGGRVRFISKLSTVPLAMDGSAYGANSGYPHPGGKHGSCNVLWADGHVTVTNAPFSSTP
jgi:prepilin-type N-terminal cleavage/methylation domain-containing protein/prepilin-type processing-associated H-X9-DG protein